MQEPAVFQYAPIWPYFRDGEAILYNPILQKVLNSDAQLGYHGVPQMPMFVYKAIHDEATPIASTDALVDRWCGVGVQVLYKRLTTGGHGDGAANGDVHAMEWLKAVFDGTREMEYAANGCRAENVTWG